MSQATAAIANMSRSLYRAAVNAALQALQSKNSGLTEPSETYAYMEWADTTTGLRKVRNAANSAWITKGTLADDYDGMLSLAGGTMTGALNEKGFTVAAHATTCDIWTAGNFGTLTGSVVTFTDVADAPVADAWRLIRSNAAHVLTDNANIAVQGNANYTLADGDLMLWHAITTTTFEVFIFKADGTSIVGSGITIGTPVATTSGTSVDITGIPAGTKRITIGFNGVSTNGTSDYILQIGDSGGIEASGYLGVNTVLGTSSLATVAFTAGFGVTNGPGAADVHHGAIILSLENSSTNTWVACGGVGRSGSAAVTTGVKSLSGVLDRVRLTTTGGANTFDAGEINISYE